jgi:hypothetical protein
MVTELFLRKSAMKRSQVVCGILASLILSLTGGGLAYGQSPCSQPPNDIPVGNTLASAGFFDNLRNSDDSIRFKMDELLSKSEAQGTQHVQPPSPCSQSCVRPVVAIVFSSVPNMTLPAYEDSHMCQKLLEETSKAPIVYSRRTFEAQEDADEWYNDLTQGEGVDGEDLYNRCPGSCSPAYSSLFYRVNNKLIVTTSIICGHARDKDDNQYRLSSSLRWICS